MVTSLDKNTALILIDLQNGIVNFPITKPAKEVLAKAAQLVSAFRKENLTIVVVNVDPTKSLLNDLRKDVKTQFVSFPDKWYEIAPEIKTTDADIFITKNAWNAFSNPALDLALKKRGITGIVLAGISTSVGVEGTARAASERGYNLTFAIDAMADTNADAHEHSVKRIFPRIGEVDDTEKIIEKLIGQRV
ncbi:isochorismatase family protein [Pedobacter fastidiosus]|uniref:Isochorismatase family protein n=1 Tax=Pedobacter fastidiosus TaxID=2765361 RepID=A0ABR7KLK6_9SPHI|nr:isochorismatase family protein [Pedobacter fastidiosus]MBC6108959.1 isochorismatase family protein [Pedobacter fastidiosus]